jgi:hypothetical protein
MFDNPGDCHVGLRPPRNDTSFLHNNSPVCQKAYRANFNHPEGIPQLPHSGNFIQPSAVLHIAQQYFTR